MYVRTHSKRDMGGGGENINQRSRKNDCSSHFCFFSLIASIVCLRDSENDRRDGRRNLMHTVPA